MKPSELSEKQKSVLEFVKTLDHPATTNEVRDKFGFPLRANARRILKKLAKLGHGEYIKTGIRYHFHVEGKLYKTKSV